MPTTTNSSIDYRIAKLSAFGLLGFFLGFMVLFLPDSFYPESKKSIFHEINYSPKEIIGDSIVKRINSLRDSISALSKRKEEDAGNKKIKNKDSITKVNAEREASITNYKKIIGVFERYNNAISTTSNSDTSGFETLNKAIHFNITPDTLSKWDDAYGSNPIDRTFEISYSFKDPGLPAPINGSGKLDLKTYAKDVQFLAKYPAAGKWLLSILIFCSFCCMTIALCCFMERDLRLVFKDKPNVNAFTGYNYYYIAGIMLIILVLLGIVWKNTFYDEEITRNIFFMRSLSYSKWGIFFFGYIAGALCLAGFIHTASHLGYFASEAEKAKGSKQPVKVETADQGQTTAVPVLSDEEKLYTNLNSIFNNYFILSAVILSLVVLGTGGLYGTINSLDFVKLVSDDWGYSPARSDFVMLYGALHTVILLLIYIPARIQFTQTTISTTNKAAQGNEPANSKWYNIVKNPFASLKDLLIATSPLLASLVQALFDNFFK